MPRSSLAAMFSRFKHAMSCLVHHFLQLEADKWKYFYRTNRAAPEDRGPAAPRLSDEFRSA
jgi:hypothetical protein